jgi:hypothetical protein
MSRAYFYASLSGSADSRMTTCWLSSPVILQLKRGSPRGTPGPAQFEHRTGANRCVRRNRRRQKKPAGKPTDATRDFPSRPSLTELACAAEPESPTVERAPGLRLNSAPAHAPLNGFHFGLMTGPGGGLLSTHFTAHMTVTFKSLLHILRDDFFYRTTHRNSKTELQKSRHIK